MAATVFLLVVGARFLVPLLIPRFPLPAIVAALVLDGIDQTVFQRFGFDPPGYQGYDKAMDVYYLAIAYLSTLRNWTSRPAVRVARFLYFYRLIGVVAFELTDWRPLLMIFPNTFEYFFIAYEVYRLFWNPARVAPRSWIVTAAVIWIFVKLPQEWWIHIAQLDFTETVAEVPWFGPACLAGLALLGLGWWFVVRPRQPAHDWEWHVAADPLPAEAVTVAGRNRWVATHGRLWSVGTLEKVTLIGLLWVIYSQVLPATGATPVRLFLGTAVFVLINAVAGLTVARSARGVEPTLLAFGLRVLLNVTLVAVAGLDGTAVFFFVLLLSLLTLLDDRYRPIHDMRFAAPAAP
ncbi:hypothetical protein [Actinoplanes subglobosus]|uniref:Uncharacterized protein n=1 Tax=Actinoplanes subglobosus TaxID=1547892 RepID=A0ABV8J2B4_9ACTN